ncbi:MAG TPA: RNA polymerase sigma factor [Acidimicrobiales bacterium]|nr:RNA polymerase sigma factor [Acidimicrobiales bacterium]
MPGPSERAPGRAPDVDVAAESELLVASWSNPAAFGELYARTCGDLTRWFAPRAVDPEIVADLVAETYAELLSSRRRFSPRRGHARQFLWGIAHHQLAGWQRRGYVERRWRERAAIAVEPIDGDPFADADARLDERLAVAIVQVTLDTLSATDRRALILRIGEQRPYDAVAAELGCSIGAARVRVSRALAKLSARFADQIGHELR